MWLESRDIPRGGDSLDFSTHETGLHFTTAFVGSVLLVLRERERVHVTLAPLVFALSLMRVFTRKVIVDHVVDQTEERIKSLGDNLISEAISRINNGLTNGAFALPTNSRTSGNKIPSNFLIHQAASLRDMFTSTQVDWSPRWYRIQRPSPLTLWCAHDAPT